MLNILINLMQLKYCIEVLLSVILKIYELTCFMLQKHFHDKMQNCKNIKTIYSLKNRFENNPTLKNKCIIEVYLQFGHMELLKSEDTKTKHLITSR